MKQQCQNAKRRLGELREEQKKQAEEKAKQQSEFQQQPRIGVDPEKVASGIIGGIGIGIGVIIKIGERIMGGLEPRF